MSNDLVIEKGSRHCKILNGDGEVVFRTTNLRDAHHYVDLVSENRRLEKLLDARGMAPHRIYLLAAEEADRGRATVEQLPVREVVIVAKAGDGIVVRDLQSGKEEIVDLEEIEPIEGGSYLQATETSDELLSVVVRIDKESDSAFVAVFSDGDQAEHKIDDWGGEEPPDSEFAATVVQSIGETVVFSAEASID